MHIQEVKLAMEHNLKTHGAAMGDFAAGDFIKSSVGGAGSEKSAGITGLFKNQLKAETLKLEKPFERPVEKPYEKPAEYKAEKNDNVNSNAKLNEKPRTLSVENDAKKTEAENSSNRPTVNKDQSETENAEKSLAALEASGVAAAVFQTNIDAFDENAASPENLLLNLFAEPESYAQLRDADLVQTGFEDERPASDEFDAFFEKLSLSMLTEEKETEDTESIDKNPMLEFVGLDEMHFDKNNLALKTSSNAQDDAEAAVALENDALASLIGNNDDSLINVIDERTITGESALRSAKLKDGEGFVEGVSSDNGGVALGVEGQGKFASGTLGVDGQNQQKETKFSSMLSREIQNKAGDFVKAGNIVMRDNNQGVIRLALNPGSLGDVKINLRLNGNEISANIAVASEEAFLAFKDSLASIKAAFSESGFGTGDFNLSWTGGGQGQEQGNGKNHEAFSGAAALTYVDSTPDAVQSSEMFRDSGVNLVA